MPCSSSCFEAALSEGIDKGWPMRILLDQPVLFALASISTRAVLPLLARENS
jgi:hypothetical protein